MMLVAHRYMSKAPGKVEDYDGSGPWFKIYDWGWLSAIISHQGSASGALY